MHARHFKFFRKKCLYYFTIIFFIICNITTLMYITNNSLQYLYMKDNEFVITKKFRLKKTYVCICIDLKNDESYCVLIVMCIPFLT